MWCPNIRIEKGFPLAHHRPKVYTHSRNWPLECVQRLGAYRYVCLDTPVIHMVVPLLRSSLHACKYFPQMERAVDTDSWVNFLARIDDPKLKEVVGVSNK